RGGERRLFRGGFRRLRSARFFPLYRFAVLTPIRRFGRSGGRQLAFLRDPPILRRVGDESLGLGDLGRYNLGRYGLCGGRVVRADIGRLGRGFGRLAGATPASRLRGRFSGLLL